MFIGVGGSGGTTLRYLYQEILNGLQEIGWDAGMPDCWQFLLIDVAQNPDGIRGDVPNVLTEEKDYFGIAKAPATWETFLKMLPASSPEVVAGWKPRPPVPGDPTIGAGQLRALGRLAAMTQLGPMNQRIQGLQQKLGASDAQLQKIADKLGVSAALNGSPHAFLISSLGGGSGSGMFLDVSQVLNALQIPHSTVLYTPDVFDGLGASGGNGGVTPNSMAAVSELISAFEHTGPFSEADSAMLRSAGVNVNGTGNRTAKCNIIVGRKAEGWEFDQQAQVYHTTARALASMTLDGFLSEEIDNYVFENKATLTRRNELNSLRIDPGPGGIVLEAVQSIGYAAVATGLHTFGTYASERLTNHLVSKIIGDDDAVQKFQERESEEFLRQARAFAAQVELLELGSSDQILNAVRGGPKEVISDYANAVRDEVRKRVNIPGLPDLSGDEVDHQLESNFTGVQKEKIAEHRDQVEARAQQWTIDAQARILDHVVASIAIAGLPLTVGFLRQMERDLNAAGDELASKANERLGSIPQFLQSASAGFSNLARKVRLAIDSQPVANGLEFRRNALAASLDGSANQIASQLVVDFAKGVVRPLADALAAEHTRFRDATSTTDMKSRYASLASGPTPSSLKPSVNEFFLEDAESYPGLFRDTLADLFNNSMDESSAVAHAAAEVLAGVWQGMDVKPEANRAIASLSPKFNDQGLIKVQSRWITGVVGAAVGQRGSYAVRFDFDQLLKAGREWQRTRTGVGSITQISLYDYLADQSKPERMENFVQKLQLALAKSGCMIQVDMDALQEFTAGAATELKMAALIGKVPIDASDPAAPRIIGDLMKYGDLSEAEARAKLVGRTPASRVEIVTVSKERAHPAVFRSIADPILDRWASVVVNPVFRRDFFTLRRSRTLPSFVPTAPSVLVSMVKGWNVARMLGYIPQSDIDAFKKSDGHAPIRIFDPKAPASSGRYWSFPEAVLRGASPDEPLGDAEVFPAIIESMILGFAGLKSGGLRAYARLADLGKQSNSELDDWITTGTVASPEGTTPAVGVVAGWASAATAEERLAKVKEILAKRRGRVNDLLNTTFDLESIHTASRDWEIREEIKLAIESLTNSVGITSSSSNDDEPGL
jgi:hypothetical protein